MISLDGADETASVIRIMNSRKVLRVVALRQGKTTRLDSAAAQFTIKYRTHRNLEDFGLREETGLSSILGLK